METNLTAADEASKGSLALPRYGVMALIFTIFILMFIGGCGRRDSSLSEEADALSSELYDSISAGNVDYYKERVANEKRDALAAGDSLRWAGVIVQEGVMSYYLGDPATLLQKSDSAIKYLLSAPQTEDRDHFLQKAYSTKGAYFSQYLFNPDSAIFYHKLAVETAAHSSDRKTYMMAMGNLADTYKLNTRLAEASDYYHRAILLADSLELPPSEYIALYGGLASTYTGLRDFEQSQRWWDKTMKLYPLMMNYEKFNNLNNLGNDYYYQKRYPEAEAVFRRLTHFLDSVPSMEWEHRFADVNLAECYLYLDKQDSAAPLIARSMEYFTQVQPNPVVESYLHTLLMHLYASRGEYAKVEALIACHPFSDTLRVEQQLTRLEAMQDYYENTGNTAKAFDTHKRKDAIEDTLRSERVEQLVAAQRIQYEGETELLRLRADRASSSAHILRLTLISLGAVVVMAVLAVIMSVARARARRREERMHNDMIALRMQSIRTRITPHFIYNALNHEILARQTGRESRLNSIVKLLRHQQYVAEEIVLPLNEEISFVDEYVQVESQALEGEVKYTVEIAPGMDPTAILIPSMSLQILVENAFKHSFQEMAATAEKRLAIDVRRDDATHAVIVTVYNNESADAEAISLIGHRPGLGIKIIMQSLTYINHKANADLRFDIEQADLPLYGYGVYARIIIPEFTDLSQLNGSD